MSDIYGADAGSIEMGNARMQQVRDFNARVAQHNQDVSDQMSQLKDQIGTMDNVRELEETAKGLWSGAGMPNKVKAYQDWRANRNSPNPTENQINNDTATPAGNAERPAVANETNEPTESAPRAEPVAEGSPSAESLTENESSIGSRFTSGLSRVSGISEEALETAGKGVGVAGAIGIGGMDLYNDFKKGGWASMNSEQKVGNILQIGGSVSDIVGTAFPPAALLGGILDVTAGAIDTVGAQLEKQKSQAQVDVQAAAQQQQGQSLTTETQTTGRTQ